MIFDRKRKNIAEKKHFWGSMLLNDFSWKELIYLLDTHPENLYDRNHDKFRISLNSFHQRPSAPKFAKQIVAEMETIFYKNNITNIAFIGVGRNTQSYPLHRDGMDVFLLQVLGEVDITVASDKTCLTPGRYVYIPRGTEHHISPKQSRCTFSFGVEGNPDPSLYV